LSVLAQSCTKRLPFSQSAQTSHSVINIHKLSHHFSSNHHNIYFLLLYCSPNTEAELK